jgi:hypothetical protein
VCFENERETVKWHPKLHLHENVRANGVYMDYTIYFAPIKKKTSSNTAKRASINSKRAGELLRTDANLAAETTWHP